MDPLTFILGAGRWLIGTRTGRALLGSLVLAGVVWWAYSTVWQRGYDVAAAEGDARLSGVLAQIEAERRQSEREARDTEQAEREQQAAIGQAYEQGKADAQVAADRTITDLRAGTVRLRDHWQGCENAKARVPATPATGSEPDDGAELRRQGAGALVLVGEQADAQIRALQAALTACTTP